MSKQVLSRAPRGTLGRFVQGMRVISRNTAPELYVRPPDGEVDLVVRVWGASGDAYVIGTRTRTLRKVVDVSQAIAVRFKAGGAYPFFGVPVHQLTNQVVPLEALWGGEGARLRGELAEATTGAARLRLVEEALGARLGRGDVFEPASAHLARRAVRALREAPELPTVEELARSLGVSARQLRRIFDDVVGVGPKAFARIVRFQRAVRASEQAPAHDWGTIARAVGYYDQAHLIADFRALTGATPGALTRPTLRAAGA